MKRHVEALVREALNEAVRAGALRTPADVHFIVDPPVDPSFGDLTTDVAMLLARRTGRPPQEIGDVLVEHMPDARTLFTAVEVAGPGFVNFRFSPRLWRMLLREALDAGDQYGISDVGRGRRVRIECVTAARDLGDGRSVVVADACTRLLEATGYTVERRDIDETDVETDPPAQVAHLLGPDRHASAGALRARARGTGTLRTVVVARPRVMRGGSPVSEVPSFAAIVDEIGVDAARFALLLDDPETESDLDLELVKRESSDNPLFWVQYAYARLGRLLRDATAQGLRVDRGADLEPLGDAEIAPLRVLAAFPDVVVTAARNFEPHRLAIYAQDLAGAVHRYYNRHRIPTDDPSLTQARLALAACLQGVLRASLGLAGVSAPERM